MLESNPIAFVVSLNLPRSIRYLAFAGLFCVVANPTQAGICTPSQSGAVTEALGGLRVGDGGVGTYSLDGSSCSESFSFLTAGFDNNGNGTVTLENGASLSLLNRLDVSQVGTGLVTVASGSQVTTNDCRISYRDGDTGSNPSGTGTLVVTGPNSGVTCNDELQVGTDGMGTLELSDGAQLTAGRTGLTGFEANATGEIRVLSGASLDITGSNGATHIVGVRGSGRIDIDAGSLSFTSPTAGTLTTCTVGGCDVEINVSNGGLLLAQFIVANNNTMLTLDGGTIETQQHSLQVAGNSILRGSGDIVGDLDNRESVFPGIDGIGQIAIVSDDDFDGNFSSSSGSNVEFEITSGASFDSISVDRDLVFNGNVDVVFVDSFVPPSGSRFEIITVGGGISWSPNSVDIIGLPSEVLAETMVVEEESAIVVTVPEPDGRSMALVALITSALIRLRRPRHSLGN